MDDQQILLATQDWLVRAVIGLNLCPFAKAVYVKEQIRYSVSGATDLDQLQADLLNEIQILLESDPEQLDTTLLIHPRVLENFYDFNDFLDRANDLLVEVHAEGILQIASFHPHYQFAGTEPDAIENFTNRSPFPTLHLIREASIERAVESYPDPDDIYQRNIRVLKELGVSGWRQLFHEQAGPVQ